MIGKIPQQHSLLGTPLKDILNPTNRWAKLTIAIPWDAIEEALSVYSCKDYGHPSLPIPLMVGLLWIKQIKNLSDEAVVAERNDGLMRPKSPFKLQHSPQPLMVV